MTLDLALRLAFAPVLIAANGFFVAAEFALTRLPSLDLDERDLERSPGLRRASEMVERLELHLTGCQLGISTTSVLLGVISEPAVTALIEPALNRLGVEGGAVHTASVVLAVVILNLAHKIWGEQAPTYLGVERPRQTAERLAPLLYWWSRVMGPAIRLGDAAAKWTLSLIGVEMTRSWAQEEVAGDDEPENTGADRPRSRGEIKRRIAEVLRQGLVPRDRRREVLASLEIDEIPVCDVMTDAAQVTALGLDLPLEENLRRIGEAGHVRYPVCRAGAKLTQGMPDDEISGVLYLPALCGSPADLLAGRCDLRALLEPAVSCSPNTPVADLIDQLQARRQELALVLEDDRLLGIVTITDALEAIAGDVEDPLDER